MSSKRWVVLSDEASQSRDMSVRRGRTFIRVRTSVSEQAYRRYVRESRWMTAFRSHTVKYRLVRPLSRLIFPFTFIRRGDVIVQAGCVDWMIPLGVSHAIIAAELTGPQGKVLVIEPDPANVRALTAYLDQYSIRHVAIDQVAAWHEPARLQMAFFDQRRSFNTILNTRDRNMLHPKYAEPHAPEAVATVRAEPIDDIVCRHGIHPQFVNLTINGSEFEAIQGLDETIRRGASIAFPLWGAREWCIGLFDELCRRGLNVLVGNSPYSRFAQTGGAGHHLYAYATSDSALVSGEYVPATFSWDYDAQDIRVQIDR